MEKGTELGREAKRCIDQGLLVPDKLTMDMLLERLDQPDIAETDDGIVIDGFPRTFNQATALLNEAPHLRAILLEIDQRRMKERILGRLGCPTCGRIYSTNIVSYRPKIDGFYDACPDQGLVKRADDCEELLDKRWNSYIKQTVPAIEFYKAMGRLVDYGAHSVERLSIVDILKSVDATR